MLFANNLNFPTFKHRDSINIIAKCPSFLITSKNRDKNRKSNNLINLSFQTRFETSQNNISNNELKEISVHHKNETEKTSSKKNKPINFVDANSQIKKDLSNFRNFLAHLESKKKNYNLFVKKHSQSFKKISTSKNVISKESEKTLDSQKKIKIKSNCNLVHRRNAFERTFSRSSSILHYERMKKISSQLYENFKRYIHEMKNPRKTAKDLKSLCWNRPKLLKILFKNNETLIESIDRFFFEEHCVEKAKNLANNKRNSEKVDLELLSDYIFLIESLEDFHINKELNDLKRIENSLTEEYENLTSFEGSSYFPMKKKVEFLESLNFKKLKNLNMTEKLEEFERLYGECKNINKSERIVNKRLEKMLDDMQDKKLRKLPYIY